MADTTTTAYGLTKPEIGASEDTWGTKINTDLDTLDTVVNAIGGKTAAATLSYADAAKVVTSATGIDVTGNATFADNGKAIFGTGGASPQLQIYTDGSHSYLLDNGTGNLRINTDNQVQIRKHNNEAIAYFNADGAVQLYYDSAPKFATTDTGIDVTGTVTADGLTVDGNIVASGPASSSFKLVREDATVGINNQLGAIVFASTEDGGTTVNSGASISSLSEQNHSTIASGSRLSFSTTPISSVTSLQRLNIANTGDISFYDSAGSSQSFFWDASAESLGIGTTSPQVELHIASASPAFRMEDTDGGFAQFDASNGNLSIQADQTGAVASSYIRFQVDSSEAMRILSSGNVGIGTTSPDEALEVNGDLKISGSGFGIVQFGETSDQTKIVGRDTSHASSPNTMEFYTNSEIRMRIDSSGNVGIGVVPDNANLPTVISEYGIYSGNSQANITANTYYNSGWKYEDTNTATRYNQTNGVHYWYTAASGSADAAITWSESMRIDSSGNLLVGTTSTGTVGTYSGFTAYADGSISSAATDNRSIFSRRNSDGEIIQFRKDDSPVGSIGAKSGRTYFADDTYGGISFSNNSNNVYPVTNAGATTNGALDLGGSSQRFKDLWLSGGVFLGGTGGANHLHDYEEGTWTPVFSDAASGGNTDEPTAGKRGQYTKIGRQVTVTLGAQNLRTVGMTSTNDFYIQGLPFTPLSVATPNQVYTGSVRVQLVTFNGYITTLLLDNTTYFRLAEIASGVGADLVRVTEIADGSADLDVTITYFTST